MTLQHIETQIPWKRSDRFEGVRYSLKHLLALEAPALEALGLEPIPVPEPEAPPPATRLEKAELVRRMTSQEVGDMLAALDAHPDPKTAELYRATVTFDSTAPEYPVLKGAFEQVLGSDRAAIVLEPQF